jgi:hypothetical protein
LGACWLHAGIAASAVLCYALQTLKGLRRFGAPTVGSCPSSGACAADRLKPRHHDVTQDTKHDSRAQDTAVCCRQTAYAAAFGRFR